MADFAKPNAARLRDDDREFRRIYLVTFVFFFAAALVARFLPSSWSPFPRGADGRRSIYGAARAAAYSTIPFAFMG